MSGEAREDIQKWSKYFHDGIKSLSKLVIELMDENKKLEEENEKLRKENINLMDNFEAHLKSWGTKQKQ